MKRLAMSITSLALAAGATFATTAPAQAQPVQDGLVNVAIGDVTILEDVNVALAANVVANVCGLKVGPVVLLGRAVDRSGDARTFCTAGTDPVSITQN